MLRAVKVRLYPRKEQAKQKNVLLKTKYLDKYD